MGKEARRLFHFQNDIQAPLYCRVRVKALFPSRYFLLFFSLACYDVVSHFSSAETKHRKIYSENTSCARHHAIKRAPRREREEWEIKKESESRQTRKEEKENKGDAAL